MNVKKPETGTIIVKGPPPMPVPHPFDIEIKY